MRNQQSLERMQKRDHEKKDIDQLRQQHKEEVSQVPSFIFKAKSFICTEQTSEGEVDRGEPLAEELDALGSSQS